MATNIAVLASGNGSNAQNIFELVKNNASLNIACVVTDNPEAGVIKRSKDFGIPVYLVAKDKKESKQKHEERILKQLDKLSIKWVLLAGYMRILTKNFINHYFDEKLNEARIVNIHPSLLPAHKGLRAYEKAYSNKDKDVGVTLHFIESEVDSGKIIFQKRFYPDYSQNIEKFKEKGFEKEFECYRLFLNLFNSNGEFLWNK